MTLKQQVDALELVTSEDKLVAIAGLCFFISLSQLEKYLGLTEYLQQYISKYAVIVKPLQLQKTFLNQGLRVKEMKENARKCQVITIRLNESTFKKLNAFHHLQTLFFWPTMLIHFLSKHQLYVDLNAFKKFEFETHVYHTKKAKKNSMIKVWKGRNSARIDCSASYGLWWGVWLSWHCRQCHKYLCRFLNKS